METLNNKTKTQNIDPQKHARIKQRVADAIIGPLLNTSLSIDVKNVTVSFPTAKGVYTAVKDIDLQIKKGEIVALIGHSGCGKSTLMGTISGMVRPSQGEVIANGKKVTGPGPDRGIVFQNYSLLPWLTVFQNIYEAVDSAIKSGTAVQKRSIVEANLNK